MPIVRALAAIGLALIVSGCGLVRSTIASYDVRPNGQQAQDYLLRRSLARGRADSALKKLAKKGEYRPDDKLLAQLYIGVTAYYAGEYKKSAHALQVAHDMAEDRYTKSVSKGSLSMITNDRALPYMPGDNERLLIHYYGMLAYLRMGELEDAAVEARRLSFLLERFDEKRSEMDGSTRAVLRYLAGAVFEAAGDGNDAEVAYRNAVHLVGDSAFRKVRVGSATRTLASTQPVSLGGGDSVELGEIVVVLEYGFVAHRVHQQLLVAMDENELELFGHRDDKRVRIHAERVSNDMMQQMQPSRIGSLDYQTPVPKQHSQGRGRDRDHDHHDSHEGLRFGKADIWMKIAWPVYHRPPVLDKRPWVTLGDGSAVPMELQADVSDAVVSDYNRQSALLFARALARAAVKEALAEAAEEAAESDSKDAKKKKKSEAGAWFAKTAVSLAGDVMERADTRSWQVLPSQLGVIRLQVPAGVQSIRITVPSNGRQSGQTLDLGEVNVRPGALTFVTARAWGDLEN